MPNKKSEQTEAPVAVEEQPVIEPEPVDPVEQPVVADGIPYEIDGRRVSRREFVDWQSKRNRERVVNELRADVTTDDATAAAEPQPNETQP